MAAERCNFAKVCEAEMNVGDASNSPSVLGPGRDGICVITKDASPRECIGDSIGESGTSLSDVTVRVFTEEPAKLFPPLG
jgi:hypothetical protein